MCRMTGADARIHSYRLSFSLSLSPHFFSGKSNNNIHSTFFFGALVSSYSNVWQGQKGAIVVFGSFYAQVFVLLRLSMCASGGCVCVFCGADGWSRVDKCYPNKEDMRVLMLILCYPPYPFRLFFAQPCSSFTFSSSHFGPTGLFIGVKRANTITFHLLHIFFLCYPTKTHTPCVSAMRAGKGVERQGDRKRERERCFRWGKGVWL